MVRPWTAKPAKSPEVRLPPPAALGAHSARREQSALNARLVTLRLACLCPPPSLLLTTALLLRLPTPHTQLQAGDEPLSRVPSLMELCMSMIANNLHTIPSIEYLPSHLMKDILDRRKNECMTDADLGFFLAATFEAVPAEQLDFLSMRSCRNVTDEGFGFVFRRRV